jgi:predicted transcriptional regulator
MPPVDLSDITKREREILDILFARGKASAAEVLDDLRDPPSYSAVRTLLHRLEQKGFVAHVEDKRTYIYAPVMARDEARENAITHLLKTFFNNSTESAVAALLTRRGKKPSAQELERVKKLVEDARKRGR